MQASDSTILRVYMYMYPIIPHLRPTPTICRALSDLTHGSELLKSSNPEQRFGRPDTHTVMWNTLETGPHEKLVELQCFHQLIK